MVVSPNLAAKAELEKAVECLGRDNVREARTHVRRAEAELALPLQRLPSWVVPGACVVFDAEPSTVLRVTEVRRGKRWSFKCWNVACPDHVTLIHQERGPLYWHRCDGPVLASSGQSLANTMAYPHRSGRCRAGSDGDCDWPDCPQTRDGEPEKSGRSCPLLPEHEGEEP